MDFSFLEALLDPIFVLDDRRRILHCNQAAASMLDSSVRRLSKGVAFSDVCTFDDATIFPMPDAIRGIEEPLPLTEIKFKVSASGKMGKVQITIQPFHLDKEKHWILTARDVTLEEVLHGKYRAELEQKEHFIEELKSARDQLEDYSKNLEKKVDARTAEVKAAHQTLRSIMDSLGQGFVTLNRQGVCGDVYTKACEEILEGQPQGQFIWNLLKLDAAKTEEFKMWLEAVFSEALPFESLRDLAPSQYAHSHGRSIFLEYFVVRSEDSTHVEQIVLVATDRTLEVEAQRALDKERSYVRMVTRYLRNKESFVRFVKGLPEEIQQLRQLCLQEGPNKRAELFRALHTLEGEAGTFGLDSLRLVARELQGELNEERTSAGPQTWGELASRLNNLLLARDELLREHGDILQDCQTQEDIVMATVPRDRLEAMHKSLGELAKPELSEEFHDMFFREDIQVLLRPFQDLVQTIADKQGKRVRFVLHPGPLLRISREESEAILSSLVHAFRNAVDHGIELPEERRTSGKSEEALVEVNYKLGSDHSAVTISIRDDGRGLNIEELREKLTRKVPGRNWAQASDEEVMQGLFLPGFSSRDEVGEFSGRGVGLDAVMSAAQASGGRAWLESQRGWGTTLFVEWALRRSQQGSIAPLRSCA